MSFAVVQFMTDQTYSEVPISWLSDDRQYCFWPSKAKNTFSLMAKGVQPDTTWNKFEIKLDGIYSSLKQARRKAEHAESSTEDDNLGKGKRKRIRPARLSHDYSSSDDSSSDYNERDLSSPPPQFLSKNSNIKSSSTQGTHFSRNIRSSSVMQSPINTEKNSTINSPNISENIINSAEIIFEAVAITNNSQDPLVPEIPLAISDVAAPIITGTSECTTSTVTDSLLEEYSSVRLLLQSIDDRLKRIESSGFITVETVDDDLQAILDMLPFKDIETLERFEQIIVAQNQSKSKFIKYVNGIGGHHVKDNIYRILKRTFTNELGVLCSWMGLRNNYKVCTLNIIQIIKDVILKNNTIMKEKEVEDIISEWFRLSKLRMQRQTK